MRVLRMQLIETTASVCIQLLDRFGLPSFPSTFSIARWHHSTHLGIQQELQYLKGHKGMLREWIVSQAKVLQSHYSSWSIYTTTKPRIVDAHVETPPFCIVLLQYSSPQNRIYNILYKYIYYIYNPKTMMICNDVSPWPCRFGYRILHFETDPLHLGARCTSTCPFNAAQCTAVRAHLSLLKGAEDRGSGERMNLQEFKAADQNTVTLV